jgi:hypothetical protein
MHVTRHWAAASTGQQLWRAACAVACAAVVMLVHGVLWLAVSKGPAPHGVRTVAVQVRQLTMPATAPLVPGPQATGAAPPAESMRDAPSRRPRTARSPPRVAPAVTAASVDGSAPPDAADALSSSSAAAAPSMASPVETHPTRIPSSTQLNFRLQRGADSGEASLRWQVDAGRYALRLQATLPRGRTVEQRSQGGFDEAGLAPERLADQRHGRDVRAANFQREQRKISFSGPRWEWPLHDGTQDRLSWLVQLTAIAAAAPDALRDGAELSMWVAGTRGALSLWRFEVRGREQLAAPSGDASAWWLVREPEHPYDLRIEVWLDPARGHWPLRLRQTQVPGGEPLEWALRDEPQSDLGN